MLKMYIMFSVTPLRVSFESDLTLEVSDLMLKMPDLKPKMPDLMIKMVILVQSKTHICVTY